MSLAFASVVHALYSVSFLFLPSFSPSPQPSPIPGNSLLISLFILLFPLRLPLLSHFGHRLHDSLILLILPLIPLDIILIRNLLDFPPIPIRFVD